MEQLKLASEYLTGANLVYETGVNSSYHPVPTRDLFVRIVGELSLTAWLTACLWAIPVTLRSGTAGVLGLSFWLAFAAAAVVPSALLAVAFRMGEVGLRKAIPTRERRVIAGSVVAIWSLATLVALTGLAMMLSKYTHHRGLSATTFAILAAGIAALIGLCMWRLGQIAQSVLRRPWVAGLLLGTSALVLTATSLVSVARAPSSSELPAILAVADVVVFGLVGILASRVRIKSVHRRVWVPAAILALVATTGLGISQLQKVVVAGAHVRERTVVLTPLFNLLANPDTVPIRIPRHLAKPLSSGNEVPVELPVPEPAPSASLRPIAETPAAGSPRPAKPDIIVITLDSVRRDHLGMYGYTRKTSPNLDTWAKDAIIFDRAYASGPETRTAIAPLFTGRYLVESVRDNRDWPTLLRPNETLAERLREAGYSTAGISSFQWVSDARGFSQGFDVFDEKAFRSEHPEKARTSAQAVAQAMTAYDRLCQKDSPIFLWVHLFDPHSQYLQHEDFKFGSSDRDRYDSEIAHTDRELQRLLEHVKEGTRHNKTLWLVHGSHGEAFGEHGFSGHPPKMFDELLRVPFIMKAPWLKAQRSAETLVSTLDIVPTLAEIAGASRDACSGLSLVDLVQNRESPVSQRRAVLVAFDGVHGQPASYGWVEKHAKYVLYAWEEGEKIRVFDLQADPGEKKDIKRERGEQASKLREDLDRYLKANLKRIEAASSE